MSTDESFFFFWKRPELSQWGMYNIFITYGSEMITFNCAEQGMMYAKAMLHVQHNYSNLKLAERIMQTEYPAEHKRLGRLVAGFDQDGWDAVNMAIVYTLNWYKFTQNIECKQYLLATSSADVLVEASPFDPVWGIGVSADDPRCKQRSTWLGQNKLGQVLTKVRNDIIAGGPDPLLIEVGKRIIFTEIESTV